MKSKYIHLFPKPLLDDLVKGKWLPVIGAGLSRNAIVPSGKAMPLWNDLGQQLAAEMPDYPYSGPLDAISAYEHEYGRVKLIERLADALLVDESQPGSVHKAFCSIPFDIVCTTNFDFLLERGYEITPRYCRVVIDEDQLSVNMRDAGVLLLKLHGDLHHPSRLVVSERDYDAFLPQFPLLATYLANLLITRTAVLVGYSLDDPDFRQVWHVVSERLGRSRRIAFAIVVDARPTDIARFERRGIKVLNLPGPRSRYAEVLTDTFNELREHIRNNIIVFSQVTQEEPLRELSLPRDTATRLCFFALPLNLQPIYQERVFPIAREAGLVPVTADDVISPGDNWVAKIDALLERSAVIVVELSSPWTLAELRMAIARGSKHRVLVITTDPGRIPSDLVGLEYLVRPDALTGDLESFLEKLSSWFSRVAADFGRRISDEPIRLYEAREYRAAVIAAVALLEVALRERLTNTQGLPQRSYALRKRLRQRSIKRSYRRLRRSGS